MASAEVEVWNDRLRQVLGSYDEGLLREAAERLCKPRSRWPAGELIDRCLGVVNNPAMLDRRVKDLDPVARSLLALMEQSRQPSWPLGSLVELTMALGQADGLKPLTDLLGSALLFPERNSSPQTSRLKSFHHWLSQGQSLRVFTHPGISRRAAGSDLGLPPCPDAVFLDGPKPLAIRETDGLEWLLRLAVVWQQVKINPLRRTMRGDFFKRDLERLRSDPLLTTVPSDNLMEIPDPGLLVVVLALHLGVLGDREGELYAGTLPTVWQQGLPAALASVWAVLPHLDNWNAERGWNPEESPGNPYPSACLLLLALLENLPENAWASPVKVADWVLNHHPYWKAEGGRRSEKIAASARTGLVQFLLGLAYQLRMIQATRGPDGEWLVRLSCHGRWLLGLEASLPPSPAFPQTLLVQPNLEILVYRQGLTPELIFRLGRFATWKTLGAACTLQFDPESVYRALESGETFESILQTLEAHGMKGTPAPVVEALRTWSNKRERIRVYTSGALFEFASPEDLQEALARGLQADRLGNHLAVVANEGGIDYRHFRLTGTRDYCLPPEKCVAVEPDGVTLTIDLSRSDLLLEPEIQRFAERVGGGNGRFQYRMTPASLSAAMQRGLSLPALETWFQQRADQPLPPAARFLLAAPIMPSPHLQRELVLTLPSSEIADGLLQWPQTRDFFRGRLGPTAILVKEDRAEELKATLANLGIQWG